jgi:hypothetical protein
MSVFNNKTLTHSHRGINTPTISQRKVTNTPTKPIFTLNLFIVCFEHKQKEQFHSEQLGRFHTKQNYQLTTLKSTLN